jgi:hypothetical protein
MLRNAIVSLAMGFAGVLVGIFVSTYWRDQHAGAMAPAAAQIPAPPAPTLVIQQVAAAASADSISRPIEPAPDREAGAPMTVMDARKRLDEGHAADVARHEGEQRTAWGVQTARVFSDALTKIGAKAKFEVQDVDCRSETCTADVQFPNFQAATNGWFSIASGRFANDCRRDVLIDDPRTHSTEGPMHAAVFFDCAADEPH